MLSSGDFFELLVSNYMQILQFDEVFFIQFCIFDLISMQTLIAISGKLI